MNNNEKFFLTIIKSILSRFYKTNAKQEEILILGDNIKMTIIIEEYNGKTN